MKANPTPLYLCFVAACAASEPPPPPAEHEPPRPPAATSSATPHSGEHGAACAPRHQRFAPVAEAASATIVLGRVEGRLHAVVADRDDRALRVIDLEAMREVAYEPLEGRPEQVLALRDGRLATSLADRARVVVHELGPGGLEARCARPTPAEPAGLAQSQDGQTLAVASRWEPALTFFEGSHLAPSGWVELDRDPYGVAFDHGGATVLVSHVVGGRVSRVHRRDRGVTRLDASRDDFKAPSRFGPMPQAPILQDAMQQVRPRRSAGVKAHRVATQSYAIVARPDGSFVFPASLADPSPAPSGSSGYGGGGTLSGFKPHAGVNMVLSPTGKLTVPPGTTRGSATACILPRDAAWDEERGLTWVACLGHEQVFAYDGTDVARYNLQVEGGVTGIALDRTSQRLVTWSQYSARVGMVALPDKRALHRVDDNLRAQRRGLKTGLSRPTPKVATQALERRRPLDPQISLGRSLFHQAGPARRIAMDGRACASCHPGGRDDGLSWSTLEGPRQTPILAGRIVATAPYGWNGRNEELDGHMQRTLHRLRGTGLKREERDAIAAYLRSLEVPEAEADGGPSVERGRRLYTAAEIGCASCHDPATATTDGRAHDLGVLAARDQIRTFDTPSLRFVARSAPYFHDGRYPTLTALLADPDHNMGHAADLDEDDRHALEAYLRTL